MPEVFVYGTLQRGGKWAHTIPNAQFIGPDTILGELYLDEYRGAPILFHGEDVIPGEVFDIPKMDLGPVDVMEREFGYNAEQIQTGSGREVLVYVHSDDTLKERFERIPNFDAAAEFRRWYERASQEPESSTWQYFTTHGGRSPESR